VEDPQDGAGRWWDWGLLARWVVVNAAAYVVVVVGGVALELLASATTSELASDHRWVAVVLVAVIGAGFHGFVLGRWQWRILVTRIPGLQRRHWVIATLVPALVVWLLAIAPGAVDILAQGGDTLAAFKNGFIQAIVLGPLISKEITPAFPLLGFLIYGVWMLWVTAPEATAVVRPSWAGQGRHRTADPDIPD
jgi:hypothetical protein